MKLGITTLCFILSIVSTAQGASHWPSVKPETGDFHVSLPTADPNVAMTIFSPTGKALYRITCGTYSTPFGVFDYSGEFECRLQSIPASTYSTLFTEYLNQD